ncbi:hypothetical protein D3C80_1330830 [compost metagenome]
MHEVSLVEKWGVLTSNDAEKLLFSPCHVGSRIIWREQVDAGNTLGAGLDGDRFVMVFARYSICTDQQDLSTGAGRVSLVTDTVFRLVDACPVARALARAAFALPERSRARALGIAFADLDP